MSRKKLPDSRGSSPAEGLMEGTHAVDQWHCGGRACHGSHRRFCDGRRDAETRRHADLHDPGRRAAELRRAPREHLCDVHSTAPFYSLLIRVNPENPARRPISSAICAPRCRSRPTTARPTPSRSATGVKFHDGSPLTAADVAASWNQIIFPPRGVFSPRQGYFLMVDKVEAPDPKTVVFRLKFATSRLPAGAGRPVRLHLQEGDSRQGPALVREERHGLRPLQVRRL